MLGYVIGAERGAVDRLMAEVAARLGAEGWPLAGVVQINSDTGPATRCDMDLQVLAMAARVRISQSLGPMSRGCRLDPQGLEEAVGLVERALEQGPKLLLINKFGKAELEGRGFRPVIGHALATGVPVLTAVNKVNLDGFETFSEGMGTPLPPQADAVIDWCRAQVAHGEKVA
ncbi:MAG: Protein of unknown function (DUF2478) [Rhodobacteraceae bacterium HLUCCA12]|nr:MAG: Protein of unknown function (DUF2478) [Rhodobacteraceae bacterium HLUCCA12]